MRDFSSHSWAPSAILLFSCSSPIGIADSQVNKCQLPACISLLGSKYLPVKLLLFCSKSHFYILFQAMLLLLSRGYCKLLSLLLFAKMFCSCNAAGMCQAPGKNVGISGGCLVVFNNNSNNNNNNN